MAKTSKLSDLKAKIEEAELNAQLSEARARSAEAVFRTKKARLLNGLVNEKNVRDFM